MRLVDFIHSSEDDIVHAAMAFARTLAPFTAADDQRVRNHLPELLQVIVKDLRQSQTVAASIAKSHGQAVAAARLSEADLHAPMARSNSPTLGHPKFPQAGPVRL